MGRQRLRGRGGGVDAGVADGCGKDGGVDDTEISSGIPAEEKGRDENTTEDKLMTLTSRKD